MKVKVWGARGSIPAPGPETTRYGGNTSCVEVTLADGTLIVLDAGTGIRPLGIHDPAPEVPVHVLLTHLHLDHIQGLMFYNPLFRAESELNVWGPAAPDAPLRDRIARYISAPLAPVEVRELPCQLSFREAEPSEWRIGSARVSATSVTHRGPTLGYRIEDEDSTLVYIPDHEPGLGASLDELEDEWISGLDLARDADLLIHDCQYTDDEYPNHLGWGHSALRDTLDFANRAHARRLLLFHHDPLHSDDFLDGFGAEAAQRWAALGHREQDVELAVERAEVEIAARPASGV